jgi:hypothetical protein
MRSGWAVFTAAAVLVGLLLLSVLTGVLPPAVLLIAAVGVCASMGFVASRSGVDR